MKKISSLAAAASLRPGRDQSKLVKYTPHSIRTTQDSRDDELDEIAVVSNAAPEMVKYGSSHAFTANGPRVVPGIITSTGGRCQTNNNERLGGSAPRIYASPMYPARPPENLKSSSRQSLLDTFTKKLNHSSSSATENPKLRPRGESMAFVNKAHLGSSDLELSRKARERRKELKREFERWGETSTSGASEPTGCSWTFVFDPSGRLCYYWSMVVSVAVLYNFWAMIYRFAFFEINRDSLALWFLFDYLADLVYVADIAFHFRTGYLEEGVLQTDAVKLRQHYMNSTMFYIDCLCLLPLDFLYLSIGFNSILRCFRLVKVYRFWGFLDRTERHTNYPNVFRALSLTHYMLVIFHWNACFFHIISINNGFGTWNWFRKDANCSDTSCAYLQAFYWSTLALSTIGDLPQPKTKGEYTFVIVELIFGLFLFAAVLGHVANIVTNVSAARKEFQAKLDAVKTYIRMRRVPDHIQSKVIRWFDYLWMTQKCSDEEKSVACLPDKLKAEIAIHVHLDTLKRVEIFQNTEAGFLCELVLRLRPVLFSPGDYICRKGEVGKEMYIVNRGRLQVVADNGKTVLAILRAGSYFGEISILNMGTAGNRRTASVRSVGYSDLFCLYKQDMWEVLKDYPAARIRLEAIAVKRLEKYKTEPLRTIAMGRCRSTPGLIESKGKVPLEDVNLKEPTASFSGDLSDDKPTRRVFNSSSSSRTGSEEEERRKSFDQLSSYPPPPPPSSGYHPDGQSYLVSPMPSSPSPFFSPPSDRFQPNHVLPDHTSLYGGGLQAPPHLSVPMQQMQQQQQINSYRDTTQEALLAEIKRLRERLVTLEAENATMSMKLSQQQYEMENRLAEIELQICGGPVSSPSTPSQDENERNQESII